MRRSVLAKVSAIILLITVAACRQSPAIDPSVGPTLSLSDLTVVMEKDASGTWGKDFPLEPVRLAFVEAINEQLARMSGKIPVNVSVRITAYQQTTRTAVSLFGNLDFVETTVSVVRASNGSPIVKPFRLTVTKADFDGGGTFVSSSHGTSTDAKYPHMVGLYARKLLSNLQGREWELKGL